MKQLENYKFIRNELYDLIHSIDPAALGGATGEYDREVDAMIKLIMSKKAELTKDEITSVFSKAYKEYSLEEDEINQILSKIKEIVEKLY